jgi:hypothetical protein
MAKKVDFKEFLMQKGERLGFGIALVVMICLIGFGTASGVMAPSPSTTAENIKNTADDIKQKITFGDPEEPPKLAWIFTKSDPFTVKIKPEEVAFGNSNFGNTGLDNNKKLNPLILVPDKVKDGYHVDIYRAAVRTLMLSPQKDQIRIGWLVPLDKPKGGVQLTQQQQAQLDMIRMRFAQMQAMGIRPNFNPAMMPGGMAGLVPGADGLPSQEYRLEYSLADKPPAGAEPAEDVTPCRMVIVSAAFPYLAQLHQYCSALGPQGRLTPEDLSKNNGELLPKFQGVRVRRREIGPDGKPREWKELDFNADYKPLLNISVASESETMNMKKLVFQGLVMPRPALAKGSYPEPNLGAIEKALRVLNDKMGKDPEAKILTPLEKQITGETIDVFGPGVGPADPKGVKNMPDKTRVKDGDGKEAKSIPPDHCLVRFVDVTVKPGVTYQYQMQIVAANPNFKRANEVAFPRLAEVKELTSAWGPEDPIVASLPPETYVYGVEPDERVIKVRDPKLLVDKEIIFMQIHRWLETTSVNPDQRGQQRPVADWSIADVPVRRGEYIGRPENVKVPMWFPHKKAFDIAVPIVVATKTTGSVLRPPPGPKGIPVNFITEPPELLVDWEGGKINQTFRLAEKAGEKTGKSLDAREEANVEYLILSPDGKLRVRSSRADKIDPERKARYDEWDSWVRRVEAGGGKTTGGTGKPKVDPFGPKK